MTETELADRLDRLEQDNRRFKRLAAVALVIAAAISAIYAARPVPDVIKAHSFEAVDASGTARVMIWGNSALGPSIAVGIANRSSSFTPIAVTIADSLSNGPSIQLSHNKQGRGGSILMGVSPTDEPSMRLWDEPGFEMDLGSTGTVNKTTGATQQTSVASIMMFGNDKEHNTLIWKAP